MNIIQMVFYGRDFPSNRNCWSTEHGSGRPPRPSGIVLFHVAITPRPSFLGESWTLPQYACGIGARIGELGRQPRMARKFFGDIRIEFFWNGCVPYRTTRLSKSSMMSLRDLLPLLETEEEYFDYATRPVPPQGRGRIYVSVYPIYQRSLLVECSPAYGSRSTSQGG